MTVSTTSSRFLPPRPMAPVASALGVLVALAVSVFLRIELPSATVDGNQAVPFALSFEPVKWAGAAAVSLVWLVMVSAGALRSRKAELGPVDFAVATLAGFSALSFAWSSDLLAATLSLGHVAVALSVYLAARLTERDELLDVLQAFGIASIILTLGTMVLFNDPGIFAGFGNPNFLVEAVTVATGVCFGFRNRGSASLVWATRGAFIVGMVFVVVVPPANLQFLGIAGGCLFLLAQYR